MSSDAVVDNLPEVPPEKFGKLSGLLQKLFSQVRHQGFAHRAMSFLAGYQQNEMSSQTRKDAL